MALTTIALHIEPGPPDLLDAALALPLAIAEAHAAHVTAVVFEAGTFRDGSGADMTSLTDQDLLAREDAAAGHVRRVLHARGLRFELRGRSSFAHGIGEVFADQMRVSDIGMMTFSAGADPGRRFVASGGIFHSGRPLLLLPPGLASPTPPSRIVVAWDASVPAVRAVHGALALIGPAAAVTVVSVTDDKEFRPGQSGVELTHLLARHGANATFVIVPRGHGGVAGAVLDVAQDARADLIVMGAVRHTPLHDLVFGSATRALLARGPALPTLLAA